MIENKKFTKNFIWNTVGSIFNAFNSLFIMIIITRINGLESVGTFSVAFATASILYVLANYSGRNCHITDIKGEINDKEYIVARIITCITTVVIMFIYIILIGYDASKTYTLIALCTWKILEAFSDVLYAILQKNEKLYKVGISLLLKSIIGIGVFGICDIVTKDLELAFSLLYMLILIITIIYDIPNALKLVEKSKKVNLKNVVDIYRKEFWIFGNTFLIMYILNEPKYIIERYLTNDIQAIFNIILMPASVVPLFSQFIMAPIINNIKNLYKEKEFIKIKQIDNKITVFILFFGIIAASIGSLIGIPVLEYIYNQELDKYKIHLSILLIAYTLYAMAYVKTIILTVFRKLKEQFTVHIISTLIIIISSVILISNNGIIGAVITYFILMSCYYIMLWGMVKYNYMDLKRDIKNK